MCEITKFKIMQTSYIVMGCWVLMLSTAVSSEKAFFFQGDNIPTATAYAKKTLDMGTSAMYDLSVCFWFNVYYFREKTYLFSYATSDKDNNELNLGLRYNTMFIAIGGKYVYGLKNNSFIPGIWYHTCIAVNSTANSCNFYINGKLGKSANFKARDIYLNGSFYIGQEADSLEGEFNEQQSFSGYITRFNLFNRTLTGEEILGLANCTGSVEGDIIKWDTDQWVLNSTVQIMEVDTYDFCPRPRSNIYINTDQMVFKDAIKFCEKIKSNVYTPYTESENMMLYEAVENFTRVCVPKNHASSFMWLGVTDSDEEGVWTDLEGKKLTFNGFPNGYANTSKQDCASFEKFPERYMWNDVSCSVYKFCSPCQYTSPTILRMRGMCEEDKKAAYFQLDKIDEANRYNFRGFSKYQIFLNISERTWLMHNTWTDRVVASWFSHNSVYPFGLVNWTLTADFDICERSKGTRHLLLLSGCYDDEFTCSDGSCVPQEKRCDLRVDCPDSSDEVGCSKLQLPEEYMPFLPPPAVDDAALKINISVEISGFSEIDIRDMKITVDLNLEMMWFDLRIKFKNLKALRDLNYIDPNLVWNPSIELVNADFPRIHKTKKVIFVNKLSNPEKDDPSNPVHDEIYLGQKNGLIYQQKINAPFSCDMDLQNFPFDIQFCYFRFRLTSARKEYISWNTMLVKHIGNALLTEYEIGEMTIHRQNNTSYSEAIIKVPLYRRFWFYITSAYLPTLMLMLISYASLFCNRENADLRVMMAITTLLVLYALYQQIADGLPRTSYTKAVDVWCFFAITFIFSQVILHVFIDVDLKCILPRCRKSVSTKDLQETRTKYNVLRIAQIVYIVIFVIFFIIYCIVVATNVSG